MGLIEINRKNFLIEDDSSGYNVISLPQPFATMITSGIIKFLNTDNIRKFKEGDCIIVYAKPSTKASYKELWNDEYYSRHYVNACNMGEIPEELPSNSFIGTIRIGWVGHDGTRYVNKSGLFKEPLEEIPLVKTFELQVPGNKKIRLVDRTIKVPLSKELWDKLNTHIGEVGFYWMQYFNGFYSDSYGLGDYKGKYDVIFNYNGRQKRLSQVDDQAVKKENYELLPEHHKFLALVFHFDKLRESKDAIQQYYESLTTSLFEETREIIAKHYPHYQTLLNYVLEGSTPNFSEYTDSQMIISQLEDVCAELGTYYTEKEEPQIGIVTEKERVNTKSDDKPIINNFKAEKSLNDNVKIKNKAQRKVISSVSQLDEYGQMAAKLVREGNNLFITGKAGTGKSTVLRVLVQDAKDRKKNVVVLAPTGVAAKVAKGMTIHSFLHLPLGPYIPGHRIQGLYHLNDIEIEIIRKLDIIFIDEVSMVRCDLLDEIDDVLRHYRKNKLPFGGIQIVMFGDLYQLMPVADDEDKEKLSKACETESLYFFKAKVYMDMNCKTFELMKIYRQAENDFKDLLNDVREGYVAPYEIKKLESRYRKNFSPSDKEGYIRITTHNYRANKYNRVRLENLPGKLYDFKASIPKGFITKEEWPTDYHLRLKEGARVMFLRNDPDKRFVNGTLGTVIKLTDYSIRVLADDGEDIDVDKSNWDFYKYKINKRTKEIESELVGTFRQYPLRLAWAVTIHKSQGMQFSKVIIDAGHAFAYGQVYVALSRCEVFHNIFLVSKITSKIIQTDPVVKEFMRNTPKISLEGEVENGEVEKNRHHLSFDPLEDTLWMIKDGLTIDQIISQSNEPSGIIYGRLMKLIKRGDVDINSLLPAEKYRSIKSAFDKLGHTVVPKRIKNLCPECNFGEINLVKASLDIE